MIQYEELQMNALPSLQTILYDGWVLRFAKGYTNRANSVNPIYEGTKDVSDKIHRCEELYKSQGLKPTYKITPFVCPSNLDQLLETLGYTSINQTSVQSLSLQDYVGTKDGSCKTTHTFDANWFEQYCRLNHISEQNAIINREILMNLIPDTLYTLYYLEDQVIACGMAVVEDGYLGLFDITVSEEHRNLGYGAKLIGSMLSLGKECGAKTAYLQVMLNNPSAFHLYQKFGFTQMYQYHYRTTPK